MKQTASNLLKVVLLGLTITYLGACAKGSGSSASSAKPVAADTSADSSGTTSTETPTSTATPTSTPDATTGSSGTGDTTVYPAPQQILRCGSLYNLQVGTARCSVNAYTGSTQPIGMIMQMKKTDGIGSCAQLCSCTGGSKFGTAGWSCGNLPSNESVGSQINSCGSRRVYHREKDRSETICGVNQAGSQINLGTNVVPTTIQGNSAYCAKLTCSCDSKISHNYYYSGWSCK